MVSRAFRAASRARAAVSTLSKMRFRDRRVLIEVVHQPVVNSGVHDAVDLGVDQLHFGLRFESRIRQFDAQHANQTFPNVVAGNGWILVLGQAIRARILIDRLRQRGAKTGQMRSAVGIRNGVGETKNLIVVAVVVLQNAIDKNLVALSRNDDRLRMNDLLVLAQAAGRIPRCRACKETSPFSADRFAHPTVMISSPGFKNASSRNRVASRSNLNSVVMVKIVGSGKNVISVPVFLLFLISPMT